MNLDYPMTSTRYFANGYVGWLAFQLYVAENDTERIEQELDDELEGKT